MKKALSFFLCLAGIASCIAAIDLWQHPETAERNSLFVGASGPEFTFSGFEFQFAPQFTLDYMLPVRFPFSLGAFLRTPTPNLNSFGARLGYHINLDQPRVNLYFLYVFDFGFLRNDLLERYGDERRPLHFYDFRAGVRWGINRFLFIQIESDFQFRGIIFGLSAKLF
ncbi:MAG: hypothetical protein LBG93_10010 [Treponema sp.]|jgi:hypothetical protein|nr:hypothetical protein [Treponema sp.]